MSYNKFLVQVINILRIKMGTDYFITINKAVENNGFESDGLVIMKNGESILPPLYLQSYFRQLKNGISIEEIVEEICFIYKNSHDNIINFLNGAENFEYLKGKIVYRLIRRQGNEVFLSDVPFTPYVDLAVVYYLLLEVNKFGQITALIRNEHLILWNIKLETLHRAAEVNTAKMLPVSFRPIWDIVSEIIDGNTEHENESATLREDEETINPPLFVLSNSFGAQGAACLLYKGVLKGISDKWKSDIIILPSSVHETLLLPDTEDILFEDLQAMVKSINRSEVDGEEVLSDHIYLYKRRDDTVVIAL